MRKHLFLWILIGYTCAAYARKVDYTLAPVWNPQQALTALQVTMHLKGDPDGQTRLRLPSAFGDAQFLYRAMRGFTCISGQKWLLDSDSTTITVQHPPNARLQFRYQIVQDWEGTAPELATAYRPWLSATRFHVLGTALFVYPYTRDGYEVQVKWANFPKKWLLHSSFGPPKNGQCAFKSPDSRWLESLFVGGDQWRLHTVTIAQQPVYLLVQGTGWSFSDTALTNSLKQIVQCQRNFWNDTDIPYYTVSLVPLKARRGFTSYLGTGLQNAFATFATPTTALGIQHIERLFHHELMHHWIGGQMRNGGDPNDMQLAWFSEGFTEYFAYLLPLQCGLLDTATFLDEVNQRFFKGLWTSEVASRPNAYITANFFTDRQASELPYLRGFVFAYYLDRLIEVHTDYERNLGTVMRTLLAYYRQEDRDLLGQLDFTLQALTEATGQDVRALYQKHILDGQLIPAQHFSAPRGFAIKVGKFPFLVRSFLVMSV